MIKIPVYQYRCSKCDEEFELKMRMEDYNKIIECPLCKSDLYRIPSMSSFELKGGGWAGSGYSKGE